MPKYITIDVERARQMRSQGLSWDDIGTALGVTGDTAHRKLDPNYAAKRRDKINTRAPTTQHRTARKIPDEERVLIKVGPDTRTWQQKMLGDPPAGRSALAMRKQPA